MLIASTCLNDLARQWQSSYANPLRFRFARCADSARGGQR